MRFTEEQRRKLENYFTFDRAPTPDLIPVICNELALSKDQVGIRPIPVKPKAGLNKACPRYSVGSPGSGAL